MNLNDNMRYTFQRSLLELMQEDENVFLLLGDLGYKIFDDHRSSFPERVINCGAAEQAMIGMGVGLAQTGKYPFIYSITPFLLYRGFETIRTYVNHERPRLALVGSGRDKDYAHDGMSHWAEDDKQIMKVLRNVRPFWPEKASEVTKPLLKSLTLLPGPVYLNLKR